MNELAVAAVVFLCLAAASLGAMFVTPALPERHRSDETSAVVRLIANIFVVMTSLVFGLMINSARSTYSTVDANVHAYGTNLILLDRTLRTYGIQARDARQQLIAYVEEAIANPARAGDSIAHKPDSAGAAFDALGNALSALRPPDSYHERVRPDARQQSGRAAGRRGQSIEPRGAARPPPLAAMLVAWLLLIFGSFGYRAPRNEVVIGSFLVSAAPIAAAFYLVLDMDIPFSGPIQISDAPLHRALAEMRM